MNRIIIILVGIFIFTSCEILSTREPEQPVTRRTQRLLATTPETLFQNLINSFKEKFVDDYMSCFVDTVLLNRQFKFIPAGEDVSQFPILSEWNLKNERDYFINIASQTVDKSPITLQLIQTGVNNFGDSAYYQFDYSIVIVSTNESIQSNYRGNLKFKINLDKSNQWVITEWEDIREKDYPSWSELKGRFAN